MKLSDLKFLFPRFKYSKHTPKAIGYSENHFMKPSLLEGNRPKILEKSPKEDNFIKEADHKAFGDAIIGRHHAGRGGKLFM
jgi:hypothetical protein